MVWALPEPHDGTCPWCNISVTEVDGPMPPDTPAGAAGAFRGRVGAGGPALSLANIYSNLEGAKLLHMWSKCCAKLIK